MNVTKLPADVKAAHELPARRALIDGRRDGRVGGGADLFPCEILMRRRSAKRPRKMGGTECLRKPSKLARGERLGLG